MVDSTLSKSTLTVAAFFLCVGCSHFANNVCSESCRVKLCINLDKINEGMPLVALEETVCDAQVLTNLLCEANPVGQGEFNEIPNIYCCQIFETNGIPAFLTSVDADLGVVQRISCHMIFRTSFGYYAFPREWNMEDNPTVRSERYVAIVKKMMARCWGTATSADSGAEAVK